MKIKPGVKAAGLKAEALLGITVAESVYRQHGYELVVTSITDGKHMKGSLHYKGLAFDCRTNMMPASMKEKVTAALSEALGPEYDVVLEPTHIHVEFDNQ